MSDNILTDPEVVQVYWEMKGVTEWGHRLQNIAGMIDCTKCGAVSNPPKRTLCSETCSIPDPIGMSVGDLAFFMRDKCVKHDRIRKWEMFLEELVNCNITHAYRMSTPEQWIRAACKAWRMK